MREILLQLSSEDVTAALIDAPLLFESGLDRECDAVVSVIADRELRIRRIMARDGLDRDSAIRRIDSQLTDEYLAEHSDYVIVNNGDFSELYNSALAVAEKILDTN